MKNKQQPAVTSRRDFLKSSAVAGGVAAAAIAMPQTAAAAVSDDTSETAPTQDGYRLTQHILEYYKTAAS